MDLAYKTGAMVHRNLFYFISKEMKLKMIDKDILDQHVANQTQSKYLPKILLANVADITVVKDRHPLALQFDGNCRYLDKPKSQPIKLPKNPNEVFTHMKAGYGVIIVAKYTGKSTVFFVMEDNLKAHLSCEGGEGLGPVKDILFTQLRSVVVSIALYSELKVQIVITNGRAIGVGRMYDLRELYPKELKNKSLNLNTGLIWARTRVILALGYQIEPAQLKIVYKA